MAPIDYHVAAERFRPAAIRTLLIGEAPPPSGKAYFYIPRAMITTRPIESDTSLPATIFHHYFATRPVNVTEYEALLGRLCDMGIFLIDICDQPIRVRNCCVGVARIIEEIPLLRNKLANQGIHVPDERMIFLLPRRNYHAHIRRNFPKATCVRWKEFRLAIEAQEHGT
jgi:hypothetical protein